MGIIITYDLSGKWNEVKDDMIDNKDYRKSFIMITTNANGEKIRKTINLPNTTLYHGSKKPKSAIADLKASAADEKVKVNRCISVQLDGNDFDAIEGVPL